MLVTRVNKHSAAVAAKALHWLRKRWKKGYTRWLGKKLIYKILEKERDVICTGVCSNYFSSPMREGHFPRRISLNLPLERAALKIILPQLFLAPINISDWKFTLLPSFSLFSLSSSLFFFFHLCDVTAPDLFLHSLANIIGMEILRVHLLGMTDKKWGSAGCSLVETLHADR